MTLLISKLRVHIKFMNLLSIEQGLNPECKFGYRCYIFLLQIKAVTNRTLVLPFYSPATSFPPVITLLTIAGISPCLNNNCNNVLSR